MTATSLARRLALLLAVVLTGGGCSERDDRPPNFIIIFTDDQGYADVGVYGAEGFATPNLDRLARDGMRFTSFYAVESACSPSRAALLTGSYQVRVSIPHVLFPRTRRGINPDELTLAELLKTAGYATAAVGKWHLGDHPVFLPTNHGFDTYFGIPYSNDMSPVPANNPREGVNLQYPPIPLMRDTTILEREPDQTTLVSRYTEAAISFIEEHADEPFFVYLAHSFPHVPLWASARFAGTTERGLYGDVIAEIDWSVGEILTTLERLDLDERTVVAFTSDNGPWLIFGNHGGSAGPFREGKGTTFEGGHRVPGIVWWPGRIPGGRTSGELVTAMDFLPTFARLAGVAVPADRIIDGHDIWPLLSGDPDAASPYTEFYYYRGGELQAVRSGRWKLHVPHTYSATEIEGAVIANDGAPGAYARGEIGLSLYDLDRDPAETENVADEFPEVVQQLLGLIEQARQELGDAITGVDGDGVRPPGLVEAPWAKQLEGGY